MTISPIPFCGVSHGGSSSSVESFPGRVEDKTKGLEPFGTAWGCSVPPKFLGSGSRCCPPFWLLLIAKELVATSSVCLALESGKAWDLLLLPQGRAPLFSTFDTWRPSLVTGSGQVCAYSLPLLFFSALGQRALSLPGPAFPALTWDQSATWDHGLGRSGDPSLLCFPGPSPHQGGGTGGA